MRRLRLVGPYAIPASGALQLFDRRGFRFPAFHGCAGSLPQAAKKGYQELTELTGSAEWYRTPHALAICWPPAGFCRQSANQWRCDVLPPTRGARIQGTAPLRHAALRVHAGERARKPAPAPAAPTPPRTFTTGDYKRPLKPLHPGGHRDARH